MTGIFRCEEVIGSVDLSQPITVSCFVGGIQGSDTGGTEMWRRMESRVTTAERRTTTASPPETGGWTDGWVDRLVCVCSVYSCVCVCVSLQTLP